MSPRPDKAQEQLRQDNRWWQKRYRRLQKRTDWLKRQVAELKDQKRRLQLEIAEYRKRCQRHEDHYQEDIVLPKVEVTRFRKHFYYCRNCGEVVSGVGAGELPGSYIGPVAKSVSSFLHFQMKVPYRKLRILFRDLFHRKYFAQLKALVKQIITLSAQWAMRRPRNFLVRRADLIARLRRALRTPLAHPRADKFLTKLSAQWRELVTCLEVPGVCAHNNLAERLLRDNVILRKITFGNRSDKGIANPQVLMSLIQTARLQNLNPLIFLHQLLTQPAAASTAILSPDPAASRG